MIDLARAQVAARQPELDHLARGAVLDRAAGVEALELGENPHAGAQQPLGQAGDLEQRRIADQLEHADARAPPERASWLTSAGDRGDD